MPRVYTSTNDPLDFCKRDFPSEKTATAKFSTLGEGPDGRGNCFDYASDHPAYEDDDYDCHKCGKQLTANDN